MITDQYPNMTAQEIDDAVEKNLPWSYCRHTRVGRILVRGTPPDDPNGYYAITYTPLADES